jgi:hypothetical protein
MGSETIDETSQFFTIAHVLSLRSLARLVAVQK